MNLSIVILPNKVLSDGTHKIRIAMSHNGNTRYIVTRFIVPSTKNLKNGKVVGKEIGNATYINLKLSKRIEELYKIYDNIKDAECYSCSQLLQLILSQENTPAHKTFDVISEEWLEIKSRQTKKTSVRLFKLAINEFIRFAGKDYLLSLLNLQTIYKYDDYMSQTRGLATTTVNMRMRVLRAVVAFAIKRGYITYTAHPFEDYKEHPEVVRDIAIPVDTLRKIINLKTYNENIELVRDIFLLSFYLCGINLMDLLRVNLSGETLSFARSKTEKRRADGRVEFTIQPEARAIIDKYISKDGTLKFRNYTKKWEIDCLLARHISKLQMLTDYDGRLIYYSARKTFAQIASEIGVQERIIAYCLGDAYSEKSALNYYISTNRKLADDAIRKVFDYIKIESDMSAALDSVSSPSGE